MEASRERSPKIALFIEPKAPKNKSTTTNDDPSTTLTLSPENIRRHESLCDVTPKKSKKKSKRDSECSDSSAAEFSGSTKSLPPPSTEYDAVRRTKDPKVRKLKKLNKIHQQRIKYAKPKIDIGKHIILNKTAKEIADKNRDTKSVEFQECDKNTLMSQEIADYASAYTADLAASGPSNVGSQESLAPQVSLPPPDPDNYPTRHETLRRVAEQASRQPPAAAEWTVAVEAEDMQIDPTPTTAPSKRRQGGSPEQFKMPKKSFKLSTKFVDRTQTTPTPTKNRYEVLSSSDEEPDAAAQIRSAAAATKRPRKSAPPVTVSNKKPPPIVITGYTTEHQKLRRDLKSMLKGEFYIKYTYNSVLIYTDTIIDYKTLKQALVDSEEQFYTYTTAEEKSRAFVLRGLTADVDLTELKHELSDIHDVTVKEIYRMKTVRARNPLFLVVTTTDITLKTLQAKVRFLQSVKIAWERRRNERRISQCRRCQLWGHAASNCNRKQRCMKCAEGHYTYECKIADSDPVKCANCSGPHTASNVDCPVYKAKLEYLDKMQPQQGVPPSQPAYVPAPTPTHNAWTQRAAQRSASQALTASQQQPTESVSATNVRREQSSASASQAAVASSAKAGYSELQDLFTEIRELKKILNFSQAILAVKELRRMLSGVTSPMEKIFILDKFESEVLPNYNI